VDRQNDGDVGVDELLLLLLLFCVDLVFGVCVCVYLGLTRERSSRGE
jgi:hypothetical protein